MDKNEQTKELALLLQSTADEHHKFEQSLGRTDAQWANWYAERMVNTQRVFVIGYVRGKQVQEVLQRYLNELKSMYESLVEFEIAAQDDVAEARAANQKDIDYVEGLIKLFD